MTGLTMAARRGAAPPDIRYRGGPIPPHLVTPDPPTYWSIAGVTPVFTYEEAAILCMRSVDTVKHLVSCYNLPRWLSHPHGVPHGWRAALPAATVRALRILTLGF